MAFKNILILLGFIPIASIALGNSLTIYQSIGEFGEIRYSQIAPAGDYQTLVLPIPNQSANLSPNCQTLKNNLATLNTGGIIHQIDQNGNKHLLSPAQIHTAKQELINAINEQCSH